MPKAKNARKKPLLVDVTILDRISLFKAFFIPTKLLVQKDIAHRKLVGFFLAEKALQAKSPEDLQTFSTLSASRGTQLLSHVI